MGQLILNVVGATVKSDEPRKGLLESKYSPVTFLSDKEYETILEEKLLRVEAEIAVVDDNIQDLRDEEARARQKGAGQQTPQN